MAVWRLIRIRDRAKYGGSDSINMDTGYRVKLLCFTDHRKIRARYFAMIGRDASRAQTGV